MTLDRRTVLGMGAAMTLAGTARAQTKPGEMVTPWPATDHFRIWPGNPPGSPANLPSPDPEMAGPDERRELWMRGIAHPTVSVFRAEKPNGQAVLSLPGGGYTFVSVENEGINVARALNPLGITVFVLTYRLPGDGWADPADVPLQDAQRAIRLIRSRAREFGIDPAKTGILGFSAGGHLGASLSTAYEDRVYERIDAADDVSARPDFAGLVYPVTTLAVAGPNSRSRVNLVGLKPSDAVVARYSAEARVDMNTPPLFFVHAIDDPVVPVEMSLSMMAAARAAGVPVEAHLYEKGGHGFGVGNGEDHPARGWTDLFARWVGRHME